MDNAKRWKEIKVDGTLETNPHVWMETQAKQHGFTFLLAYADDGVIWGKFNANGLKLSGEVFPEVQVKLRATTLQQARLFGKSAELLVWKSDQGWSGRLIADETSEPEASLVEQNWLWGTLGEKGKAAGEFTLLIEGKQGLQHAPPITGLSAGDRVALTVRHYIKYDNVTGQARIGLSRLVDLVPIKLGGE